MTKRTVEGQEFRWKITMSHTRIYSCGTGWTVLRGYIMDCYRQGVCFDVQLKELIPYPGHVTVDEQERCTGWTDSPPTIDEVLADRSVRLPDVVLDEEST